jgi:hypothetical protein
MNNMCTSYEYNIQCSVDVSQIFINGLIMYYETKDKITRKELYTNNKLFVPGY